MAIAVPFDAREFLAVAESIASRDGGEASFRTAVGRAYYAAFLVVRDGLRVPGQRNVHQRVIGELKRADRAAADQLDRLRELRGFADSDTDINDPLMTDWERNWRKTRQFATFVLERVT